MAMLTVSQVTVPLLFTKELSLKPSQAPASSGDCLQFWLRRSSRPWWPNPPVLSCPGLNLKTVKTVSHTHPKDLISKSYHQNISLTKGHGSRCLESDEQWSYGFLMVVRAFRTCRPTSLGPYQVKISQRHFSAVFEKHQDDRKKLYASAQRAFSKMCALMAQHRITMGVSMYFPISMSFLITKRYGEPFLLCSLPAVQRWWLPAKQLDSKVATKTAGCHALPAWCRRWIHFIPSSCNWAKTVHSRARDFHLQQGHALENRGLYLWNSA